MQQLITAQLGCCCSSCACLHPCVPQLKSNLLGTEYMLRTRGGDPVAHGGLNRQLLAVNYKPTINHIQAGPRTMSATVPVPGSSVRGRLLLLHSKDGMHACMCADSTSSRPGADALQPMMLQRRPGTAALRRHLAGSWRTWRPAWRRRVRESCHLHTSRTW